MVVQSCHAAIEAAKNYLCDISHPSVIVFGIKTEKSLLNARDYLKRSGVKFKEFREPDIGNELTALATEAIFCDSLRKRFKKFQLLKEKCNE